MLKKWKFKILLVVLLAVFVHFTNSYAETIAKATTDPLPSWNNSAIKKAILEFVQTATDKTNPKYVPPEQRIAAFDQDGTIWVEQPMYTQMIFALDELPSLASKHPEWKEMQPFKAVLTHDKAAIAKFTTEDIEKIMMVTHSGMTVEAFDASVKNWLAKAKNPRWNRPYTELVYQPMLEIINYLRTNGFKIYIVTGSGQDFVRVYAERVYGIPPEQIIGSALQTEFIYDKQLEKGILMRTNKILLSNNYSGKAENIYLFTGSRPDIAFGNSTGDQQMLEYTQSGKAPRLMLLIHHDDAKREYSYGPASKIGTFSDALMAEAKQNGWLVVSMKKDWKRIFPFEK